LCKENQRLLSIFGQDPRGENHLLALIGEVECPSGLLGEIPEAKGGILTTGLDDLQLYVSKRLLGGPEGLLGRTSGCKEVLQLAQILAGHQASGRGSSPFFWVLAQQPYFSHPTSGQRAPWALGIISGLMK